LGNKIFSHLSIILRINHQKHKGKQIHQSIGRSAVFLELVSPFISSTAIGKSGAFIPFYFFLQVLFQNWEKWMLITKLT